MKSILALSLFVSLGAAACGNPSPGGADADVDAVEDPIDAREIDAPPVTIPVFRNPVDMSDLALAQAAVARMGVGDQVKACEACHSLSRERVRSWLTQTESADGCFTTLQPQTAAQARSILDCFRNGTGEPWAPSRLGIYTTAANLDWFEAVFQLAYGAEWQTQWQDWSTRMQMPRGSQPDYTQQDFDIVAEWFARNLPELDNVIDGNTQQPGCTQSITAEVATHVNAMQTQGWEAINRDNNLNMYGCQGATTPLQCLQSYPLASSTTYGARWNEAAPSTRIRVLHTYNYRSSFWTRSSADGRFVAHGGGSSGGSTIIDLAQPREIRASAAYDPGFFPDNSGFVIQGASRPWCRQSLLMSNPTSVTFTEPECSNVSVVGLYQHLGAVNGGDYWAVNSQFVSDNGGGEPGAWFGPDSRTELIPMIWNGTSYQPKPQIDTQTPFEGDTILSPSAKLLLARASNGQNGQSGFVMRKLNATPNGNSYTVTVPEIARYCVRGGKPAFSYDERWITYHHWVEANDWQMLGYASATDPEFVAMRSQGTANIFILDTLTGQVRRVTRMNPGQSALFPHFRSDGWLYWIVKDDATPQREYVVASDAALVYETP